MIWSHLCFLFTAPSCYQWCEQNKKLKTTFPMLAMFFFSVNVLLVCTQVSAANLLWRLQTTTTTPNEAQLLHACLIQSVVFWPTTYVAYYTSPLPEKCQPKERRRYHLPNPRNSDAPLPHMFRCFQCTYCVKVSHFLPYWLPLYG